MPQLYSRVFLQILESSLAENWEARHVFEDLLKLANEDGVVDMTRQAISRRTNVPLEIVTASISYLEAPDPGSRDKEEDGRRLVRLDDHRDWGWRIVNFLKYDSIRSRVEHRNANAMRMQRYRAGKAAKTPPAPPQSQYSDTSPSPSPEGPSHVGNTSQSVGLHVAYNATGEDGGSDAQIEPPSGFPKSAEQAAAWASGSGVDPEFASKVWTMAAGRGFRDSKDVPIRSWRHYLQSQSTFERERNARDAAAPKKAAPVWQQIQALQQEHDSHPGNPASVGYDRETCTQAQRDAFSRIRQELANLKSAVPTPR